MNPKLEVFYCFLKLGCSSFGGPIAHIGYYQQECVEKRQWLTHPQYLQLVALCHFLPGPASSQVATSLGYIRGGIGGAVLAFVAFTTPSALLMCLAAIWLDGQSLALSGIISAFKLLAVVVVADAIVTMAKTICVGPIHITIVLAVAAVSLYAPGLTTQLAALVFAGIVGYCALTQPQSIAVSVQVPIKPHVGLSVTLLTLFFLGLSLLPLLVGDTGLWAIADSFYRVGALVFGGGHVVLPLLQSQPLITSGVSEDQFLAGYGLAQALPGPLFALASYIGFSLEGHISAAIVAVVMIFLPGLLLVMAILPYWYRLASYPWLQSVFAGVGAAALGFLLAAFYQPVWSSSVKGVQDILIILGVAWLLKVVKLSMVWIVLLLAVLGYTIL